PEYPPRGPGARRTRDPATRGRPAGGGVTLTFEFNRPRRCPLRGRLLLREPALKAASILLRRSTALPARRYSLRSSAYSHASTEGRISNRVSDGPREQLSPRRLLIALRVPWYDSTEL